MFFFIFYKIYLRNLVFCHVDINPTKHAIQDIRLQPRDTSYILGAIHDRSGLFIETKLKGSRSGLFLKIFLYPNEGLLRNRAS